MGRRTSSIRKRPADPIEDLPPGLRRPLLREWMPKGWRFRSSHWYGLLDAHRAWIDKVGEVTGLDRERVFALTCPCTTTGLDIIAWCDFDEVVSMTAADVEALLDRRLGQPIEPRPFLCPIH